MENISFNIFIKKRKKKVKEEIDNVSSYKNENVWKYIFFISIKSEKNVMFHISYFYI